LSLKILLCHSRSLKSKLEVTQDHWKFRHSIDRIRSHWRFIWPYLVSFPRQSNLLVENRHSMWSLNGDFRPIRRNIVITFGTAKVELWIYQVVNKFENMFIRFDIIHERNRHPDRQTDRHRTTALCIASRGENVLI